MSNKGFLRLSLLDVRGQQAVDTDTQIDVVKLDGGAARILRFQDLSFPPVNRLELPAFPKINNLFCEVLPKRYRHCKTDIFSLNDGEEREYELRVVRAPKQWKAQFTPWNQLPVNCEWLKKVLERSTVKVIKGETLGQFTGDKYDQAGAERTVLAKASLLNLFAKLKLTPEPIGGQRPWFSFIERILVIDRERLFALVDPEMGEIVKRIRENIGQFSHYEKSVAKDHINKLKESLPEYRISRSEIISVKTNERHANLQLTLAPARDPAGNNVMLLDADIDENGDLLNHLIDVTLLHPTSGGTHPFDIHEYLLRSHRNLQLGYELL
jgi:hypothetical protein